MNKRRLTRRQLWRINKIQDERLKRAERHDNNIAAEFDDSQLGPEQNGLVIAHYGTQVEVEADTGPQEPGTDCKSGKNEAVFRCHLRTNLQQLVTGDRIVWRPSRDNTGVVVAINERTSELCRPDAQGRLRPVAANIDRIFVVVSPRPTTPPGLIDRYLVAAATVNIDAVLLINKADLLTGEEGRELEQLAARYREIGYPLVTTSTKTNSGLKDLIAALDARTSVFVGQSGVGKSSLVNALLPQANIRTSEVSEATGKGTHTTTTARLFHLPDGGHVIDSPGIREFGLWHVDQQQLEAGFIEFRPFLGGCKFRNCQHNQEPGCAIIGAVEQGNISAERLASYRQIALSLEGE